MALSIAGRLGAITGIGNVLPEETLKLVSLCEAAAKGDGKARRLALELEGALAVLSSFDGSADLVLYYKHLMVLEGSPEYALHFNETDALSASQKALCRPGQLAAVQRLVPGMVRRRFNGECTSLTPIRKASPTRLILERRTCHLGGGPLMSRRKTFCKGSRPVPDRLDRERAPGLRCDGGEPCSAMQLTTTAARPG